MLLQLLPPAAAGTAGLRLPHLLPGDQQPENLRIRCRSALPEIQARIIGLRANHAEQEL